MKHSRKSIRRLVKFFLSINLPEFIFHQTLTFCPPLADSVAAKKQLNLLLDNIHKRFEMGSLYVEERQKNGGFHYHVQFWFFDGCSIPCYPSLLERTLRAATFAAWEKQNGNTVSQCANPFYRRKPDLDYLIKEGVIEGGKGKLESGDTHWWGVRNRKLFEQNSRQISKEVIISEMKRLFWFNEHRGQLLVYNWKQLREERREWKNLYCGFDRPKNWEDYKKSEVGSSLAVSDRDFIVFRKSKRIH